MTADVNLVEKPTREHAHNHHQTGASILHFHRKPFDGQHSIEALFENVRCEMRRLERDVEAAVAPFHSKGVFRRLANVVWASFRQREINHVTGDIQFLGLGLDPGRTVLTIHDCRALERLRGLRRLILKTLWFDIPIRRAAAVTVISQETKSELLKHVHIRPDKLHVVPNAAAPIFQPSPKRFNVSRPEILHIGTAQNKNLLRLIESLRGLSCHLCIIGNLEESQRQALIQAGISFESTCNLDEAEMYRAYCRADLVCFTSTYEGFGMPIIEAQWVERPVVTSNCSAMPEVAGDGACLVDPFDVASIRRGILRVIHDADYREHLLQCGRINRERFSLSTVAHQYLKLYDDLAALSTIGRSTQPLSPSRVVW
jgi:glycosyltransferase involved in cell wall biosynthesis